MTSAPKRALRRVADTPDWAGDLLLGSFLVVMGLITTSDSASGNSEDFRARDALAVALVLVATVPYCFRRRAPLAVFAVTTVAVAVLMLREYNSGMLPFVLMLGSYTVAAHRSERQVGVAAVLMAVALTVLTAADIAGIDASGALFSAVMFGTTMLLGHSMKARRERIDAFDEEQAVAAQRAAADERLRIAQELHDVVAHSLGVIAVQANVGMHVIDTDPAEARRSLEHISRTSRSSLAEIRRLLGMIRADDGTRTYTPAPGLADLDRLVREVGAAGLPVEVTVEGDLGEIPAGLGLAAYRIVQEALTNTLRHAGASRADVRLTGTAGQLVIDVHDDGRGANGSAGGGGHGLVGMRERVALFGGTLSAGPDAGGGFRVTARLPYEEDERP